MNKHPPQLAKDVDLDAMVYPCIGMPKIDGVRVLNYDGKPVGRSLEPFPGFGFDDFWTRPKLAGLDGEMIAGDDPCSREQLCNRSTSAVGSFKDITKRAQTTWYVFDDLSDPELGFSKRLENAEKRVRAYWEYLPASEAYLKFVPTFNIKDKAEAVEFIKMCLSLGYEGAVFRNPDAPAKGGRPTKKGQELMRYKPWMDSEALVTGVTEGSTNNNEATVNALGRTERSSHKENKEANGLIGSLQATLVDDVFHPASGELLFKKGLEITINPGKMTAKQRGAWFKDPSKIVGHIVKFQHMAHGTKDLPRFGGYVAHRLKQDM